jgi:hypothetical protein
MTQVPDGHWRVDRIANMKELRQAEAEEEKARKAALAKANADKLAQLHVVAKVHTSVAQGWTKKNRFQVRFENRGDKPISAMTGRIRLPAQEFDHGIRGTLELARGKADNAVWEFDVNQFIADTVRVYALGETDAFEVEVDSLTYADGSKVERAADP